MFCSWGSKNETCGSVFIVLIHKGAVMVLKGLDKGLVWFIQYVLCPWFSHFIVQMQSIAKIWLKIIHGMKVWGYLVNVFIINDIWSTGGLALV